MKSIKTAALLLIICLLSACTSGNVSPEKPSFDKEQDASNYPFAISFLSQNEKESFRKPLLALISDMKARGEFDENDVWDNYAAALLDINSDGVPEFLEINAGGSAGNFDVFAYDINSGEKLASFGGGIFNSDHSNAWCVYYNTESGKFRVIENSTTRGGFELLNRHIDELVYNNETGQYNEKGLFLMVHNIKEIYENDSIVDTSVTVKFHCDGKYVPADEYQYQYDRFVAENIRIPSTGMELVKWSTVEANSDEQLVLNMVNALLNTKQQFIKP